LFAKFAVLSNTLTGSESPTGYRDQGPYITQKFANKLETREKCVNPGNIIATQMLSINRL